MRYLCLFLISLGTCLSCDSQPKHKTVKVEPIGKKTLESPAEVSAKFERAAVESDKATVDIVHEMFPMNTEVRYQNDSAHGTGVVMDLLLEKNEQGKTTRLIGSKATNPNAQYDLFGAWNTTSRGAKYTVSVYVPWP